MSRSNSKKSAADQITRGDATRSAADPNGGASPAALRKVAPDQAIERATQALARHSSRKQFAFMCRRLAVASVLLSVVALAGYFAYPSVSQVPWQKYLDRFDFRLQSAIEPGENKPKVDSEESSQEDP